MDEKELLEAFIDSKQNPTFFDFKTTSHSTPDTKPPLNQQTPISKTSTIFTASSKLTPITNSTSISAPFSSFNLPNINPIAPCSDSNHNLYDALSKTSPTIQTKPQDPPPTELATPVTPPPPTEIQLTLSFRNFLKDFLDEDGELK